MEQIINHKSFDHPSFDIIAPPCFDLSIDAMEMLKELIQGDAHPDEIDMDLLEELSDKNYVSYVLDHNSDLKDFNFNEDIIEERLDNLYNNYLSHL